MDYCCLCGSRRKRNLFNFTYESKKLHKICIRCYLARFVFSDEGITLAELRQSYEEAKRLTKSPSYRYGYFLTPQLEKIAVNYFRQKYREHNIKDADVKTLWLFLKREWEKLCHRGIS